jgi:hypothetical protein
MNIKWCINILPSLYILDITLGSVEKLDYKCWSLNIVSHSPRNRSRVMEDWLLSDQPVSSSRYDGAMPPAIGTPPHHDTNIDISPLYKESLYSSSYER